MKKNAFTLAEIMIVLTVIGALSAILLPVAFHGTPDKNVIKFKKGHSVLYKAIKELVTSDKYFYEGDLGLRYDKKQLTSTDHIREYFCTSFADVLSTKKVNCKADKVGSYPTYLASNETISAAANESQVPNPDPKVKSNNGSPIKRPVTEETIAKTKEYFDWACKHNNTVKKVGAEIITTDDIVFYQGGTRNQFGSWHVEKNDTNKWEKDLYYRYFTPPNEFPAHYGDEHGYDIAYKIFCMDIDGFDASKGSGDCSSEPEGKDICPFGYGIRADGQIMNGKQAEEWIKKSISKGGNEEG